jgi:hypothetical protein
MSYLDDLVNYVVNEVNINQGIASALINDTTNTIRGKINLYLDNVEDIVFQNVKNDNSFAANETILYETSILNVKTQTNNSILTSSINSLSSNAYVNQLNGSNNASTSAATLAYNNTNAAYIEALQAGNNASILALRTIIDATSTAFKNTTTATLTAFRNLNIASNNAFLTVSGAAKDALLAENVGTDAAYIATTTAAFTAFKASNDAATDDDGLKLSRVTLTTAFNGIKAAADLAHSNSITSYNLKISTVTTATELANTTALNTYVSTIVTMNITANTAYSATIAAFNTQIDAAKAAQKTAEFAILAAYTIAVASTTGTTAFTIQDVLQNVKSDELTKAIELKKSEFQALIASDTIIATTAKNIVTDNLEKEISILVQDTSYRKATSPLSSPLSPPPTIIPISPPVAIPMPYLDDLVNFVVNEINVNQGIVTILLDGTTNKIRNSISSYLNNVENVVLQNRRDSNSVIANQMILYETNILNLKTQTNNSLLTLSINSLSTNAYVNQIQNSDNASTSAATLAYNGTNAAYTATLQASNVASILALRTLIDATSTALSNTTTATLTAFRNLNIASNNAFLTVSGAAKDALLAENVGTDAAYMATATAAFTAYKASNDAATDDDGLKLSRVTLTTAFNGIKAAADLAHSNSITAYNLKISTVTTATELTNTTALNTYVFTIKTMTTVANTAYSATITAFNTQNDAAKAAQKTAELAIFAVYTTAVVSTTGTTAFTIQDVLQISSDILTKSIELIKTEFQALIASDTIETSVAKNNVADNLQKEIMVLVQDSISRKISTPILQYETDNAIFVNFDSHILNEKIKIIKDISNNILSKSIDNYDEKTQKLIVDFLYLDLNDLVKGIDNSMNVLNIGSLSTLYNDLIIYVKAFFKVTKENMKSGFSTLYDSHNLLIDNNEFTNDIFFKNLTDDSILKTVNIKIDDITKKIRFAIENNIFQNRSNNTSISEGFLKNDYIYIPNDAIKLIVYMDLDISVNEYEMGLRKTKSLNMKGITVTTNINEDGKFQCRVTNTVSTSIYLVLL